MDCRQPHPAEACDRIGWRKRPRLPLLRQEEVRYARIDRRRRDALRARERCGFNFTGASRWGIVAQATKCPLRGGGKVWNKVTHDREVESITGEFTAQWLARQSVGEVDVTNGRYTLQNFEPGLYALSSGAECVEGNLAPGATLDLKPKR